MLLLLIFWAYDINYFSYISAHAYKIYQKLSKCEKFSSLWNVFTVYAIVLEVSSSFLRAVGLLTSPYFCIQA